jgi:tight adherence protein B
MDTNYAVFLVLGFLAVFMLLEGFFLLWSDAGTSEIKRVRERLYLLATVDRPQVLPALVRERKFSKIAGIHAWLAKVPQIKVLDGLLLHAGAEQTVADLLARVLIGLVLGLLMGTMLGLAWPWVLLLVLGFSAFPLLRLQWMGRRRLDKIVAQLPDALDLICRALRAGHAFSSTLSMVASQAPQPIAAEFKTTFDEINFGVSTKNALRNLALRVPSPDIRFFVLAVSIQIETGGNLAQLLGVLSALIRARFKFFGKVRVLAAEGKLSAYILAALPFLLAAVIQMVNPKYIDILFADPTGFLVVEVAMGMMAVGIFLLWRINSIRL